MKKGEVDPEKRMNIQERMERNWFINLKRMIQQEK
jgi:hypothetical protein